MHYMGRYLGKPGISRNQPGISRSAFTIHLTLSPQRSIISRQGELVHSQLRHRLNNWAMRKLTKTTDKSINADFTHEQSTINI